MERLYGESVRPESGVQTAIMTKIKPLKIVQEVEKLTGSARTLLAEVKKPQEALREYSGELNAFMRNKARPTIENALDKFSQCVS